MMMLSSAFMLLLVIIVLCLPTVLFNLLLRLLLIKLYGEYLSVIKLTLSAHLLSGAFCLIAWFYLLDVYSFNLHGGMFSGMVLLLGALFIMIFLSWVIAVVLLLFRNNSCAFVMLKKRN